MRLGVRELLWRPSRFGVLVGLAALLSSFGPALIPRNWLVQAVVGGVTGSLGYVIGAVLASVVPWLLGRLGVRVVVAPPTRAWAQRIVVLGVIIAVPVAGWVTLRWHRWTAEMVGMPPNTTWQHAKSMALAMVLAALFVIAGRGLGALVVLLGRWLDRVLPRIVAYVMAFVLVVGLLVWGTNSVLWRGTLEAFARSGAALNDTTPEGLVAPTSPFRSGSPGATQAWDQLGHFGRQFVSRGPSASDIEAVTGHAAVDPVRVYAGLDDTDGLDDAIDVVAREMERTGALDREVVVLITTTGNGWIDEFNVAAIEYLSGGDSATIGMQYSYLPSAVAFVTDRNTPQRVGRELLARVESMIAQRPADERPQLYVSGESLGAFGGQGAFSSPEDMLSRVDGAVWVGGPSFTPLWQGGHGLAAPRLPEVAPVIDSGRQIRFMSQPDDLRRDVYGRVYGGWEFPRVVYMQHPSDPIVWWNPSVAFSEPKWIAEQAGHDVNPRLRWVPIVTFWQLVGDMVVSTDTLSGHGHVYQDEMVPTWNQVLNTDSDRIVQITAAIRNSLP